MPRHAVCFIVIYIPPKTKAKQSEQALEVLSDAILKLKTELADPYLIVVGDFNGRDLHWAIEAYPDVRIVDSPPTRRNAKLDLVATNLPSELSNVIVTESLCTQEGTESDHSDLSASAKLNHADRFKWIKFTTRPLSLIHI